MREPNAFPPDVAPAIVAALADLCPFGVFIALPPSGAVVAHNAAAADLLALLGDARAGPIARCLAGEPIAGEEIERIRPDGRAASLQLRGVPVRDPRGAVVATLLTVADRGAQARQRRLADLLDHAARALSESLEFAQIAKTAADLAVPHLADLAILAAVEGDDRLHVRAVAHRDPQIAADILRRAETDPLPLDARVWDVIRSGQPARDPDLSPEQLAPEGPDGAWLRALDLRSALTLPLIAHGRALGALRLFRAGASAPHDDQELEVARRFGERVALAAYNAHQYEEARQAWQAREELLTVVSHDLRNPLSAIALGASVLARKIRDAEENVAVIQRSAARIERLVENLLDFASGQAGQPVAIDREITAAADLVREAVLLHKPLADKKRVRLVTRIDLADAPLFCDRTRILQVFGNLLDNALKVSSAGQDIVVRGDVIDHHACFAVSDRGPGVSETDLPHIFEPFWSVSRGGKKGLGLGLAIAKSIVEAHDGRIWAVSEPHQGTTIYFTLPLAG